jgi:hypothetical protein
VDHIPFWNADSQYFKAFPKACNPSLLGVPMATDSQRRWAMEEFDIGKAKIKSVLQQSSSRIHLSFDG